MTTPVTNSTGLRRQANRGRTATGQPNPIDVHVGGRVRLRRSLLGMSQEKLGELLGLTFQQVQKYERGANRIGSSRLFDLSRVLGVPVTFFFEDIPGEAADNSPRLIRRPADVEATPEPASTPDPDPAMRRETLDLVRAYYGIEDPQVRKRVYELARTLADATNPEP